MKVLVNFLAASAILLTIGLANAGRIYIPKDENVLKKYNVFQSRLNSLDPNKIDVLVWNIYKGKMETWKKDFNDLSDGMDILILQEAVAHSRVIDDVKRMPWMEFVFATSWYNSKYLNSETGVMTGSLAASIKNKWQRSHFLEPIIHTPKMTLFTEYRIKDTPKTLLVGNIHGINFVRAFKLKHMLEQAKKYIKNHQGPVIFAGDFNTWSKTKIGHMNKVLTDLGLKSVSFEKDLRTSVKGFYLDHVWTRGLKVLSSHVPDVDGSDHKPMVLKTQLL